MIKLLKKVDLGLLVNLQSGHYKRKITANYFAYETKYEFCRFFDIELSQGYGIISIFNSTMIIAFSENFDITKEELSEIAQFILMNSPFSVEMPVEVAVKIGELLENYTKEYRTEYKFTNHEVLETFQLEEMPKLDDVYEILKECFPIVKESYSLWLTDTSHRIRRGLSQGFIMENCTTATLQYMIDNVALIGHVGTIPEKRGKYYARKLLYILGEKLAKEGVNVRLFARENRVSYYNEIGFIPIGNDIVFEQLSRNFY